MATLEELLGVIAASDESLAWIRSWSTRLAGGHFEATIQLVA